MQSLADLAGLQQPNPITHPESMPISSLWDIVPFYDPTRDALNVRRKIGIETYGQELHTHDGRDNLADLTQEVLDSIVYAGKGFLESEDGHPYDEIIQHLDAVCMLIDGLNRERQKEMVLADAE